MEQNRLLAASEDTTDFLVAEVDHQNLFMSPDLDLRLLNLPDTNPNVRNSSLSSLHIGKAPPLPPLPNPQAASWRYRVFIVYRRLFSVVFIGNFIALIIVLSRNLSTTAVVNAVAANLMATGLARLPLVINIVFLFVSMLPRRSPTWLRHSAARLAHYGGIHSGAGVAALMWYIAFTALLTRDYVGGQITSRAAVVLAYVILFLLLAIIIAAYPRFRFKSHNAFEFTHRFAAWIAVAIFWALIFVLGHELCQVENKTLGAYLVSLPAFWFSVIITATLFIPWLTLNRVPVRSEYLSTHAVRLHFKYASVGVGQGISISVQPWKDWHSFAAFPDTPIDHDAGFSVVVSRAGDWTAACIATQPTQLWKRSVPTSSFASTTNIFSRFLVVCTGSGIGPALSLLSNRGRRPVCRVLWQTRNPFKTYGQGILDLLKQLDSHAIIIDTDREGRQDLLPLAWHEAKEFDAEAVYVISNPSTTKELVFGLEARGLPAYGPIFDS